MTKKCLIPFFAAVLVGDVAFSSTYQEKALHLLNRMSFGPRPGQVKEIAAQGDEGFQTYINRQLSPEKNNKSESEIQKKLNRLKTLKYSNQEMLEHFFN